MAEAVTLLGHSLRTISGGPDRALGRQGALPVQEILVLLARVDHVLEHGSLAAVKACARRRRLSAPP